MSIGLGVLEIPQDPYRRLTVSGKDFGRVYVDQDGSFRAQVTFGDSFLVCAFGSGRTEQAAIKAATLEADRLIQLSIDRLAELRAALQQDESKAA